MFQGAPDHDRPAHPLPLGLSVNPPSELGFHLTPNDRYSWLRFVHSWNIAPSNVPVKKKFKVF